MQYLIYFGSQFIILFKYFKFFHPQHPCCLVCQELLIFLYQVWHLYSISIHIVEFITVCYYLQTFFCGMCNSFLLLCIQMYIHYRSNLVRVIEHSFEITSWSLKGTSGNKDLIMKDCVLFIFFYLQIIFGQVK